MPPVNKPAAIDPANPDEFVRERSDAEADEIEAAIDQLGGELDDASYVLVSKWEDKAGTYSRLERCPVPGFDSMRVASKYGPGSYRFQLRIGGKVRKQSTLSFGLRDKQETAAPAAPASGALSGLEALGSNPLVQILLAQSAKQEAFLQSLLLAIVPALAGGKVAAPGAAISGADLIAAMREGRESAARTPVGHEPILDALQIGMEIAGSGGNGKRGENGSGGILERLAPRLLGLIETGMQNHSSRHGSAVSPPLQGRAPAPLQSGTLEAESAPGGLTPPDPRIAILRQVAPHLLQEARADHDPDAFGLYIAERASGELKDLLVELVGMPRDERLALLTQAEPKLATYPAWLEAVALAIQEAWSADETEMVGAAADAL